MGSPQPAEEPPRAQKSMLPHAKHLLRKEEKKHITHEIPSTPQHENIDPLDDPMWSKMISYDLIWSIEL